MTDSLHEEQYRFLVVPRSFILRVTNISDKIWRENRNTHLNFNNCFFENYAVYEIMWKML
jgi:hypothetical protein